jgi:uncharacterized membrane protein YcjF (UPF0283 family)
MTLHGLLAAMPTPTPTPTNTLVYTGDENLITPGWIGFAVTFVVAVVVLLLVIDMVRRIRKVNYRTQIRERLEQERADAAAGSGAATESGAATGSDSHPDDDPITRA